MDRGSSPQKSKIRINYCLPAELRALPGVGPVSAQTIIDARDRCDNLTVELFRNFYIKTPERLLKHLDFTSFPSKETTAAMEPTGFDEREEIILEQEFGLEEEEDLSYWEGQEEEYYQNRPPLPYHRGKSRFYRKPWQKTMLQSRLCRRLSSWEKLDL